jgi:hypothetical protein
MSFFNKESLKAKYIFLHNNKRYFLGGLIALALLGTLVLFANLGDDLQPPTKAESKPVLVSAPKKEPGPPAEQSTASAAEPAKEVANASPAAPPDAEPVAKSQPPVGHTAASISLSKVSYQPGESIVLNLIGLKGGNEATLVIAEPQATDNQIESKVVTSGAKPELKAPQTPGRYEIRLYSDIGEPKAENLLATASIIVNAKTMGAFKIELLEPKLFQGGARVKVKVSDVPQAMIGNGASIGLFRKGAEANSFIFAIKISEPTENLFVDLPNSRGSFEIRAHAANNPMTNESLVAVIPIEIK